MRFSLIGIDLDGTLLQPDGSVTQLDREAIVAATQAGCRVVPCTGRGWREAQVALRQIHDADGAPLRGVFNTGGLTIDHPTGQTVRRQEMGLGLVRELIAMLGDGPDAVLVFRDASVCGCDYLVTGAGALSENSRWWFDRVGSKVLEEADPVDRDLSHAVRVGVVALMPRVEALVQEIGSAFAGRVEVHGFPAVLAPTHEQTLGVLEVFAAGVTKWSGLKWLAEQEGIEANAIAFIGDEVNDVPALRSAGLGIAMGNAVPVAREAADIVTRHHEASGVAHAIEQMLTGNW